MQLTTTIAGTAILWLGTLLGAYHLGNRHEAANDGHAASGPIVTAGSARDNAANRSGKDAHSSRDRDAAAKPLTVKQILAKVTAMRGGSMQTRPR